MKIHNATKVTIAAMPALSGSSRRPIFNVTLPKVNHVSGAGTRTVPGASTQNNAPSASRQETNKALIASFDAKRPLESGNSAMMPPASSGRSGTHQSRKWKFSTMERIQFV